MTSYRLREENVLQRRSSPG